MAWRGLYISSPARLSLVQAQVWVEPEGTGEPVAFPLEDLAWIILDTPQVSLSGALLGALAQDGVALVVPDARHHPAGLLLSFHQHHAPAGVAHSQVDMTQPLRKRLWQRLVRTKIENQAAVLRAVGSSYANTLSAMAARVGSGDPTNVEAQAARAYWRRLFEDFRRGDEDRRNGLLNYGYAVVRAALARACAASGLLPAFGIHHQSRTNPFNLVDDLLEPFRPLVDLRAHTRQAGTPGEEVDLEDRRHMAAVLQDTLSLGDEQLTVLAATEAMAASLVRAIDGADAALLAAPALPLARRPGHAGR